MKKILISFFIMIPFVFLFSQSTQEPEVNEPDRDQVKAKVIVFNFRAINVERSFADAVTQNLIIEINGFNKYQKTVLMEKSKYGAVFSQFNMKTDDPVEYDMAYKIGKLVDADVAVYGSITKLGNNYTLNCRIVNIETGKIVNDITDFFTDEEKIVEFLTSVAREITQQRYDIEKIQKIDFEKIAITFFNTTLPQEIADNFTTQLKSSMMSFKKYRPVDHVLISNEYEKMNRTSEDVLTNDELKRLGTEVKAKYVLYGKINEIENGFSINAQAISVSDGQTLFNRTFITRSQESIPQIAQLICEFISNPKEFIITDVVLDFDARSYDKSIALFKLHQRNYFIIGTTLLGTGGACVIAGGVLLGVYLYKDYVEGIKLEGYLLPAMFATFIPGGILLLAGLGFDLVSWFSMEAKIKYYKDLKENMTIIKPIAQIYMDKINLGMSIRF